jgi:hypothetical protein
VTRRVAALGVAALVSALVALALATYVAGEVFEVVVLRTYDADGAAHETRMWVADVDGATWVRVANPRRDWYRRLLADPRVQLVRAGRTDDRIAVPDPTPEVSSAVDAAFAAKYGFVDRWYGWLLRRGAIAIRLDPAAR